MTVAPFVDSVFFSFLCMQILLYNLIFFFSQMLEVDPNKQILIQTAVDTRIFRCSVCGHGQNCMVTHMNNLVHTELVH